MCTVSIVSRPDGFRLVCNRDERLERPIALEPALHRLGHRTAVFPVDPQSGGTWIGCNDAGVTAVILNGSSEKSVCRSAATLSRGGIVPAVLACSSWAEAIDGALALNPRAFDPFRLVILSRRTTAVLSSNRERLSLKLASLVEPMLFTSSSLGDRLVEGPRRRLFESFMRSTSCRSRSLDPPEMAVCRGGSSAVAEASAARRSPGGRCLGPPEIGGRFPSAGLKTHYIESRAGDALAAQWAFHSHQWPTRPEIGVLMSRPGARTVSRTVVDVGSAGATLRYEPLELVRPAREAA